MDPKVWRLFREHVGEGSRVGDVGCGDGQTYAGWVAERSVSYTGFDISANAVELARSRGLDAHVVESADRLPAEDGAFDLVICNEVLEHLFDPLSALREARRVLAPGGRLIATVPNVAYWRRRLDLAGFGRWNPGGDDRSVTEPWRDPHLRFFTPRTLRVVLERAGFTELEVGGHGGAVLRDIPGLRALRHGDRGSALYRRLEDAFPAALAHGLHAVARRAG